MTTLVLVLKKCCVCNHENRFHSIGSIQFYKEHDLDGRPEAKYNPVLYEEIQQCPNCNYCSTDIATAPYDISNIIKSNDYLLKLNNKNFPETANAYICWAHILSQAEMYNKAGLSLLAAAWICDDDNDYKLQGYDCRVKAVEFLIKAINRNQRFRNSKVEEQLVIIDLYRRIGVFDRAKELCELNMQKMVTEEEDMMLHCELELIQGHNTRRMSKDRAFQV